MPKNVWEFIEDNSNPSSPFRGWQIDCDRFTDPQFNGFYRIRDNFAGGLFRLRNSVWGRWDVPPIGVPIPLYAFRKPGSESFVIQKDLSRIKYYKVETTNRLFFYIPSPYWNLNFQNLEWSYTRLLLSKFQLPDIGGKKSIVLPLGAQSSTSTHSGFGLIHVFRQRGKSFNYCFYTFMLDLTGLLSSPEKIYQNHHDEFWIVGAAKRDKRVTGSRQRFRWCLVLKLRNDMLVFHTMLPKADSAQFKQQVGLGKPEEVKMTSV